ncbi:hypothetical protein F6V25_02925 [Oryzomonas japonica]|uniref:Uncharacterized protein n=1 Tax=Oryzomonas japonica TaxID=2603858 RepID=A0A7J4ZVQ0_9BACT|nr:hypothetical protein [Oryzomonas japonica]KAB0667664.1 hypothetical protein F6V25_02925 [Oryzomonas japonica]
MSIFKLWNPVKVCRTRMISKDFFECKVKRPDPEFCEHSLRMGGSYICNHLDRLEFSNRK